MIKATHPLCLGTNEAISMRKAYVKVPYVSTLSLSRVSGGMVLLDADVIYHHYDLHVHHTVPHSYSDS